MTVVIGTAGWSIPRQSADAFPAEGTALERYAARFAGVEINSSFHRPHRRSTWERWRESVPAGFRFSVKVPKTISHEHKLIDCADLLARFLAEAGGLGDKLAVFLVQLPPKLAFDPAVATAFFQLMRSTSSVPIACEPRNLSWFDAEADALLDDLEIARVTADPAICPEAGRPGGWRGLAYHRLHGSPVIYRSAYGEDRLTKLADTLATRDPDRPTWCMFDNTASGAATADARQLSELLSTSSAS